MKGRSLLVVVNRGLLLAGSASGGHVGPKLVRVVKRSGSYTATLTYARHSRYEFSRVSLRIRRGGHVVLSRKISLLHPFSYGHSSRVRRIHGHSLSVTGDGRFFCEFSSCAGATVPIRIWRIDSADRFVNVTRSYPGLIRQDAHGLATEGGRRMTVRRQGAGVLAAAWCGDEYLLGDGPRCSQMLAFALRHQQGNDVAGRVTRAFIRTLNRDLRRWAYTR